MASSTPHLQLYKPAPNENVNVETDLNANYDLIDAAVEDLYELFEHGVAVQELRANSESGTTTSFTYTQTRTGATEVVRTFVAPNSGKVAVTIGATFDHSTTSNYTYMSYELREGTVAGSGTVVQAASDDRSIVNYGDLDNSKDRVFLVTGLVGGNNYHVRLMYRTATATATIRAPKVVITPEWK